MLARPLSEIYENIRDFFVARESSEVIACAALHIAWSDLAEVKSLAVSEEHRRKGLGEKLVNACLEEARALTISPSAIDDINVALSMIERVRGMIKELINQKQEVV